MIYTLGCSFTKWYWPTWSDWLATYSTESVTNWAYTGFTNSLIYYKLLAEINQIQSTDTVYIMWTGNNRSCEWYDPEWIDLHRCRGFFPNNASHLWFGNSETGFYKTHPDHLPSLSHMVIDNFNIILNTQMLLDRIGCNYRMMFWQNPWLDTRETFRPAFEINWNKKQHISTQEINKALELMNIKPVANLIKQINWLQFIDAPSNVSDPTQYQGIWEFMLASKELVMHNHVSDPHPNTLAHHDWTTQRILCHPPIHRDLALDIANRAKNMPIPPWSAIDAINGADLVLNQYG